MTAQQSGSRNTSDVDTKPIRPTFYQPLFRKNPIQRQIGDIDRVTSTDSTTEWHRICLGLIAKSHFQMARWINGDSSVERGDDVLNLDHPFRRAYWADRCRIPGGEGSGVATERRKQRSMPLKILLIDSDESRGATMERALLDEGFDQITRAADASGERDSHADVVLINIDSPDETTLAQLRVAQQTAPRPTVLFTRDARPDLIDKTIQSGVTSYIVGERPPADIGPTIHAAVALFAQTQRLRNELDQTKTTLNDRKFVERAKGILMSQRGLTEDQAYKIMQKMAMDRKRKLVQISHEVIEMAKLFTGPRPSSTKKTS
jgi:response regulator NasT